jgi:hypothetical protein
MHRCSEISPVASWLVHKEKLYPFDMFHKLKYIEQCNFVIAFIQWKDDGWLRRGGFNALDSESYLFILLDSCMLEAAVGSNDQFISCHVLGCVDAMLGFIHAVGLLKRNTLPIPPLIAFWFPHVLTTLTTFPVLLWILFILSTYPHV